MVGLAALALLSGLLIAGANLLGWPGDGGVAAASPTASVTATRTPRPTATPRPLQELTVVPDELPGTVEQPVSNVQGWLEAITDMAMVATPSVTAPQIARIPAGTVAMAFQDWSTGGDDGWLQADIQVDEGTEVTVFGWVQLRGEDGRELGRFHPMWSAALSGSIAWLQGEPDGFVAAAWPPGRPSEPTLPRLLFSSDGEYWRSVDADRRLLSGLTAVARGPTGWLAVSMADGASFPRPWIWESHDGRDWSPLGHLAIAGPGWDSRLIGSERGYVLVVGDGGAATRLWFSPDGVTWQESVDPFAAVGARFLGSYTISVVAVDAGFLAWSGSYDGAPFGAQVAFSPDGRTWSSVVVDEPVAGSLQVVGAGANVIAVAVTPDGSLRVWRGVSAGGRLARLQRDAELERSLAGVSVESLFSDGANAWALGYQVATDSPGLWSTDGSRWRRHALPAQFRAGREPLQGAAASEGVVVVGARPTVAGDNPVFWHLRPGGEWVIEPEPAIELVPDPAPAECGHVPGTAIGFAVIEPREAVACHGAALMTFVTWSAPCPWCASDIVPINQPTWLTEGSRRLLLSPVSARDAWSREGVVHPDLEMQEAWRGAWVRVTGHYADPAAEDCAWEIASGVAGYYHGMGELAAGFCRELFVVTEVTVVDGPSSAAP